MNNHYFGVDFNAFFFRQFPDSVDGKPKVDPRNQVKQANDHKTTVLWFPRKEVRDSVKNCSSRVKYGPDPKLSCVLFHYALRWSSFIEYKWDYTNHVIVFIWKNPMSNVRKSPVISQTERPYQKRKSVLHVRKWRIWDFAYYRRHIR